VGNRDFFGWTVQIRSTQFLVFIGFVIFKLEARSCWSHLKPIEPFFQTLRTSPRVKHSTRADRSGNSQEELP
jgi:hypothetical protein